MGPLARFNLNFDTLSPAVRDLAHEVGCKPPIRNPFRSIVVRSLETVHACEEALRIIDAYETPERAFVDVKPRAGTGYGCTEAPRGILYHRYSIDDNGAILNAQIVPPTSQNQKTIENDLWHFAEAALDLPPDKLTWQCEQAIRNYDPCISCSTHFLKLELDRD